MCEKKGQTNLLKKKSKFYLQIEFNQINNKSKIVGQSLRIVMQSVNFNNVHF